MGLPAKKTDRSYTYGDYRGWPDDERWELIDPGNQYVHVYRLGEDGRYPDPVVYVDKALVPSGVLPGLVIDLGDLFASVPAV